MKKTKSNIEGFVLRRPGTQIGSLHDPHKSQGKATDTDPIDRPLIQQSNERSVELGREQTGRAIGRSDIDESLNEIDSEKPKEKLTRKQRRMMKKMAKRSRNKKRKVLKRILIFVAVIIVAVGGFAVYRFIDMGGRVLQGNILDIFQTKPLAQDKNGRSNFLVLGTTEDDPNHPGSNLTDSMLVVSINQKDKDIFMFNIPRDLYVEYGMACVAGYSGKVNAYFSCINDGSTNEEEQDRLLRTQELVGNIFGLDIQYGVHINQTVLKEIVDAIGGIDVDIQGSNGAPGILDRNFDWRCNYTCYYVKYDNGVHHLDGTHALFLSQARGDVAPTYGLGNSNFDREKNQQKILTAMKVKATSSGILTNLGALTKIMDALGKNLRTNVKTEEIRTLTKVVNDIKQRDIHTISLVDSEDPSKTVVKTGNIGGASVVMPRTGVYQYDEIQEFIKVSMEPIDEAANEAAPIAVFNGSGKSGLAQTEADKLIDDNLTVSQIDNAPSGNYKSIEIYQIGTGYQATADRLSDIYGVKIKTSQCPVKVNKDIQFAIILGASNS